MTENQFKDFYLIKTRHIKYLTHKDERKEIAFPFRVYTLSELCDICKTKLKGGKSNNLSTFLGKLHLMENDVCQKCALNIK